MMATSTQLYVMVTVDVDQDGYDTNYGDDGNAVEYAIELLKEKLPQGFGAFDWFEIASVEVAP